jgi:hypothetical protein
MTAILDAPGPFRNDLIARARVNINLHAGEQFRHLSLTRTTYLLNNASTLVSEVSDTNPELRELIFEAPYEKVEEEVHRVLALPDREQRAQHSLEAFKQLPMTGILEEIL